MQRDQKNRDDLEDLSDRGFDAVETTGADLDELRRRVAAASAGRSGLYNAFINTVAGIFTGVTVFFAVYNAEPVYPALIAANPIEKVTEKEAEVPANDVYLDTVSVSPQRTIPPAIDTKPAVENAIVKDPVLAEDSIQVMALQPRSISEHVVDKGPEGRLKYQANSPVTYIHDMKVTNYRFLYFQRKMSDHLGGIPAAFSEYEGAGAYGPGVRHNPDAYLHEEIARAMHSFKKGRYDECLNTLTLISSYTNSDVNCCFYMGMCFYFKKNYLKAMNYFDLCLASSNNAFAQEATFYKAVCLDESGNRAEALKLFRQVAEEGDYYSEKAEDRITNQKVQ